jgi:hypothetical protein
MSATAFAGRYNVINYAYGSRPGPPAPLTVGQGTAPGSATSATLNLNTGFAIAFDGVVFYPLNVNAPIIIGSGSNQETITPTAVSNQTPQQYLSATVTAAFANSHGVGDNISSGTYGLQEALNAAYGAGGGVVVIDETWTMLGGTNAMITAARLTVPITSGLVTIEDIRSGNEGEDIVYVSGTVANAQVLTLNTVGVSLVAAQGAGTMLEVVSCVLENVFLTGAFTGGGVIGIDYGLAGTAASTTAAATFLTSPTANQICLLTGAVASSLSSTVLNKALVLTCATANFAAGAGSLNYRLSYRVHTGL